MYLTAFCVLMAAEVGASIVKPSGTLPETCQCVPKHMCTNNDSSVDIKGLVDIRLLQGQCANKHDICCFSVKQRPLHSVILEVPDEAEEEAYPELPEEPEESLHNTCGYEIKLAERVVGGKIITTGEIPWTTAILFKDGLYWKFLCGGSLIHPKVILTAGHCVYKYTPEILRVRAGEIDNDSKNEPLPHQDSLVADMVVHKNFHPETLKYDIALLFLTDSFIISPNVKIICLPSEDISKIKPNCESGGYGVEGIGKGYASKQLKKVNIYMVPRINCVNILRSTRLGGYFNLHKSFICAGGSEGHDTCKGDGGSPLACPIGDQPDRFVQMGIVSWGVGCGQGIPGIYANVNLFVNWIDDHLIQRQFDPKVNKYK